MVFSIKKYNRKIRESRVKYLYISINIINKIIDITSYFLAGFINKYLQTNWFELV